MVVCIFYGTSRNCFYIAKRNQSEFRRALMTMWNRKGGRRRNLDLAYGKWRVGGPGQKKEDPDAKWRSWLASAPSISSFSWPKRDEEDFFSRRPFFLSSSFSSQPFLLLNILWVSSNSFTSFCFIKYAKYRILPHVSVLYTWYYSIPNFWYNDTSGLFSFLPPPFAPVDSTHIFPYCGLR